MILFAADADLDRKPADASGMVGRRGYADAGMRGGLLTICAMIAVLGGRVTPAFTRNAMIRAGREQGLPLNPSLGRSRGQRAADLLAVLVMADVDLRLWGAVAVLAGVLCLIWLSGWRSGWTLSQPIIWALASGLCDAGTGADLLWPVRFRDRIADRRTAYPGHWRQVGGMTLAVMSRATLGHSGRALIAPAPVALAYALIPLSLLARLAALTCPDRRCFCGRCREASGVWPSPLYLAGALWPAFIGPRVRA